MVTHMQATTPPDLIGSAEACTLLCIDRSTLTRWVKSAKLTPALRGNGKTGEMFFNPADLARFQTTPVPDAPKSGTGVSFSGDAA